jgi:hypothetical protein
MLIVVSGQLRGRSKRIRGKTDRRWCVDGRHVEELCRR